MPSGSPPALGIDFGTSNTTAGLGTPHGVEMIRLEGAHTSIPTCLFFNMEDEKKMRVLFGREALAQYREGQDGRLLRSLKSVLGSSLAHEATLIGFRAYKLMDVLKVFITHLKETAEAQLGHPIAHVLLGRPVYFVDGNEKADKEAEAQLRAVAEECGFKHIAFQYEPVAAARTYQRGLHHEELMIVADLGGGTADFSILRLTAESSSIIANGGVHIGGTDFDRLLAYKSLMPKLGLGSRYCEKSLEMPTAPYHTLSTWHKVNMLYTPRSVNEISAMVREAEEPELVGRLLEVVEKRRGHALIRHVEDAKISLTDSDSVKSDLDDAVSGLRHTFHRKDFEKAIAPSVEDITDTMAALVQSAGLATTQINTVFFTGGTSAVPKVREAIMALFPQAKAVDGDLVAAVGRGLAIEAAERFAA